MNENIQWIFSGIGTYIVSAIIGFICFIAIFILRRNSNNKNITNVKGDNFTVQQKGFFNKLKFSTKSKKK